MVTFFNAVVLHISGVIAFTFVSFSGMIYTAIVHTKHFSDCFIIVFPEILGVFHVSVNN